MIKRKSVIPVCKFYWKKAEITGQGHINNNICVSLSKSKFIAGQNVL